MPGELGGYAINRLASEVATQKRRFIVNGLFATMMLCTASVIAHEQPFHGTWKLDVDVLAQQMGAAGNNASEREMMAMKLDRMKSIRYILNGEEAVIINEGYPNKIAWTEKTINDTTFEFTNPNGNGRFLVEMRGNDRLNFSAMIAGVGGEQVTTFELIRINDVDSWQSPPDFKIGMVAPPIVTDFWLNEPSSKIDLADGRVYLIEFWATWCGPCLQKMPRLVELQKEIGQDKLAIVAISLESREVVTRFLEREKRSKENPAETVGNRVMEMSRSIAIGVDRETDTFRSYMVASGFRAIPTLFIVGKSGQIEWAGSSEDSEAALRQVLNGSWDRQKFAARFVGIQRAYRELPRLQELIGRGKRKDALALIEELLEIADDQMKTKLEMMRAGARAETKDK